MIDYEVDIFDALYRLIIAEYPEAFVSSQAVAVPASFPAVSIIETSNVEFAQTADSSGVEQFAAVAYTVNIYSNSESSAKDECKAIAAIISDYLRSLNFARTMGEPIDNAADPTIYRMVLRFSGAIGADGVTYRR